VFPGLPPESFALLPLAVPLQAVLPQREEHPPDLVEFIEQVVDPAESWAEPHDQSKMRLDLEAAGEGDAQMVRAAASHGMPDALGDVRRNGRGGAGQLPGKTRGQMPRDSPRKDGQAHREIERPAVDLKIGGVLHPAGCVGRPERPSPDLRPGARMNAGGRMGALPPPA
jgi:hypothetical protein